MSTLKLTKWAIMCLKNLWNTNYFIHTAFIAYFLAIYIRRFGKATEDIGKYCWMKIRGQDVEIEPVKTIGDQEEEHARTMNNALSYINKIFFLALALAFIIFHNYYWISEKNSALFNVFLFKHAKENL